MNAAVQASPFRTSIWVRAGWIALTAYIIYAASRLEITWAFVCVGFRDGAKFIGRRLSRHPGRSCW